MDKIIFSSIYFFGLFYIKIIVIIEKNGCDIAQVSTLVKYVLENCSNLNFMGLMTIGMYGYDIKDGPNPDFICLIKCREKIHDELGIDVKDIELSMGMSSDYEHAVRSLDDYEYCIKIHTDFMFLYEMHLLFSIVD